MARYALRPGVVGSCFFIIERKVSGRTLNVLGAILRMETVLKPEHHQDVIHIFIADFE